MNVSNKLIRRASFFCQTVVFACFSVCTVGVLAAEHGAPAFYAEPKALDTDGFREVFAEIAPGVYIAGQPSEAGLERARDLGVTRVINLRTQQEMDNREAVPYDEAAKAEALGLEYVHIPAGGPDTPYSPAQLERFAAAVDGADGVLLHCTVAWRATHMWTAYLINKRNVPFAEAVAVARQLNLGTMPLEGFLGQPLTIEPQR